MGKRYQGSQAELAARMCHWPLPLHQDGFPLILLWTPKAGCTTLVKWFFHQTGELDKVLAYHRNVHQYRWHVFQAGFDYLAKSVLVMCESERPVIKLVRDPWQRAVSAFLQFAQNPDPEDDRQSARMRRRLLEANDQPPQRPTMSFREYARGLGQCDVKQNAINLHIAEQFSDGEEEFGVRIVRLEEFEAQIRSIEREFGLLSSPIGLLARSRHHRGAKKVFLHGAADLQIGLATFRRQDTPSYESFYDDETKALIAAIYRRDIERYGYGEASAKTSAQVA